MATPTIFSFTIEDAKGVKATHNIFTSYDGATTTVNGLITALNTYGGVLDAITDGQIIDTRLIIPLAPDGAWKTAPVAGSNVEQTGLFNFSQAGSKYKQGEDVPAISASVLVGGRINLTNADIISWLSALTGGLGTVGVVSKFANDLVALVDALVTFRKHRRQLDRVSYEVPA